MRISLRRSSVPHPRGSVRLKPDATNSPDATTSPDASNSPDATWLRFAPAIAQVVPEHLKEVRDARLALIAKTEAAVKDRLTKEITYWDHRAEQLKLQEQVGKPNARLNSGEARKRADNLQGRLEKRLQELKLEAQISPLPPDGSRVVTSNAKAVPPRRRFSPAA